MPDWGEIRAMWHYSTAFERQQMLAMLASEGWHPRGAVNLHDGGMPDMVRATDASVFVQQPAGAPLSIDVWKAPAGQGGVPPWYWLAAAALLLAALYGLRRAR